MAQSPGAAAGLLESQWSSGLGRRIRLSALVTAWIVMVATVLAMAVAAYSISRYPSTEWTQRHLARSTSRLPTLLTQPDQPPISLWLTAWDSDLSVGLVEVLGPDGRVLGSRQRPDYRASDPHTEIRRTAFKDGRPVGILVAHLRPRPNGPTEIAFAVLALAGLFFGAATALLVSRLVTTRAVISISRLSEAMRAFAEGGEAALPEGDEDPTGLTGRFRQVVVRANRQEAERKAVVAQSARRSESLARAGHEIRNPLSGLVLALESLGNKQLPADVVEIIQGAVDAGHDLESLVGDFLDINRLESGRIELHPSAASPNDVVGAVVDGMQAQAAHSGSTLKFEGSWDSDKTYLLDVQKVKQIARNLIGNAIKFTDGGVIQVKSIVDTEPSLSWSLWVLDDGIGIPLDEQERIFQPFVRARNTIADGNGLGLALSRDLARFMGGDITVESAPGEGSAFRVELPLTPAAFPSPAPVGRDPEAAVSATPVVLVVDDRLKYLSAVIGMLGEQGFSALTARNGLEALQVVRDERVDMILMDIEMPVMGGLEATRRIREIERSAGSSPRPIIAITANMVEGDVERFRQAGMDAALAKPLRLKDVLRAVQQHCRVPPRA